VVSATNVPSVDEETLVSDQLELELRDAGLGTDDIEFLKIMALERGLQSATVDDIAELEGFGRLKATVVVNALASQADRRMVLQPEESETPTGPPYMTEFEEYDQKDRSQWHQTGQHDGVNSGHRWVPKGRADSQYWLRRRTMEVVHHDVGGYLVPDPTQVQIAMHFKSDYFHRGLGSWIGEGRKHLVQPTKEQRRLLITKQSDLMDMLVGAKDDF
jgi:hypothetical protein